jgi:hypothetical protein
VSLAPFIVLGWLAVGVVVVTILYRGDRAGNLALAGAAMGESVEVAIIERYSVDHPVPPPDAVR